MSWVRSSPGIGIAVRSKFWVSKPGVLLSIERLIGGGTSITV